MKALKLSGSLRENVGKKDAKKLRKEEKVPCVLYGGEKQLHFAVSEKDFKYLVFTPDTFLVDLEIDGTAYRCVMKEIQYHPVNDNILHVDFIEISDDRPVILSVPLRYTGTSKGVLKGGRLFRKYRKLTIKALPGDLPDEILVDITKLGINDSIKISDLERPNIQFLDPPASVAVAIKSARVVEDDESGEEEEEAEGGAEGEAGETKTEE